MPRKTEDFIVMTEGRDKGKRFRITEMPALKAEKWAYRALLALASSGVEIPDNMREAGLAGLAVAGFQALQRITFDQAEPLLDEMLSCVEFYPDNNNLGSIRPLLVRETEGDDIEELATLMDIRRRIFALHTDFFLNGKK